MANKSCHLIPHFLLEEFKQFCSQLIFGHCRPKFDEISHEIIKGIRRKNENGITQTEEAHTLGRFSSCNLKSKDIERMLLLNPFHRKCYTFKSSTGSNTSNNNGAFLIIQLNDHRFNISKSKFHERELATRRGQEWEIESNVFFVISPFFASKHFDMLGGGNVERK
jgi:hypothetical protein